MFDISFQTVMASQQPDVFSKIGQRLGNPGASQKSDSIAEVDGVAESSRQNLATPLRKPSGVARAKRSC